MMNLRQTIQQFLVEIKSSNHGWKTVKGKLSKKFKFSNFDETIEFVNQVAKVAKKQNHHPEMNVGYDYVIIFIFDHEANKISDKCHKFVSAVNKLYK